MTKPDLSAIADFAVAAHAGQLRKGGDQPYIVHPAAVAATLEYYYPECPELIAAGWLHDVLEDTPIRPEQIAELAGERVLSLVHAVTKERGVVWSLDGAEDDVLRLKAADALDNVEATSADLMIEGEHVWHHFAGGRERKLAYYRGLVETISGRLDEPLSERLAVAVADLSAHAGEGSVNE